MKLDTSKIITALCIAGMLYLAAVPLTAIGKLEAELKDLKDKNDLINDRVISLGKDREYLADQFKSEVIGLKREIRRLSNVEIHR